MSTDPRQLGLFHRPEVEVNMRDGKLVIAYNKPHTLTLDQSDKSAIRYEAVRLLLSRVGSRGEIAKKFGIHPDTLSEHLTRYRAGGITALADQRPGPRPGRRLSKYRHLVAHAFRQDPERTAVDIHRTLPPRTLSLKVVRRILRELRAKKNG